MPSLFHGNQVKELGTAKLHFLAHALHQRQRRGICSRQKGTTRIVEQMHGERFTALDLMRANLALALQCSLLAPGKFDELATKVALDILAFTLKRDCGNINL